MDIRIQVNGEPREVPAGTNVDDLVRDCGLRPEQVAIEVNEALVARDRRAATALKEGDRVELVTLVGGG